MRFVTTIYSFAGAEKGLYKKLRESIIHSCRDFREIPSSLWTSSPSSVKSENWTSLDCLKKIPLTSKNKIVKKKRTLVFCTLEFTGVVKVDLHNILKMDTLKELKCLSLLSLTEV